MRKHDVISIYEYQLACYPILHQAQRSSNEVLFKRSAHQAKRSSSKALLERSVRFLPD
ncbi:hypothetical protein D1AOALGA4SA_4300 [Olavius algarvensis Delta 1 endosymbiont]|nr:hypothetical protein D1AOALGA4SA_4300 [Olavius algarvensis Delta 1 endosymbiont]